MEQRAQAVFTINDTALDKNHPTQAVRVLLNGVPVGDWTLGPARDAGELRILLPPDALRTTEPATFTFEIANPRSPVDLGMSDSDTRPLGFRLSQLRISPVGRLTYRPGDPIDFIEGGDSLVFIGDAMGVEWSLPGPRGSWTIGNRCHFRVSFDTPVAGDLPCSFVITDCMVSPHAPQLPVNVKANGRAIAAWNLTERRPHLQSAVIPAEVLAGESELTLTFEIAEPRSPESLGWNADPRPLGFLMARVVLGGAPAAIPKFTGSEPLHQRILGLARHIAKRKHP